MRRRWWFLLAGPVGYGVGMLLGELGFTPWKVALGTALVTMAVVTWFLARERRWMRRQVELVEQALKEERL